MTRSEDYGRGQIKKGISLFQEHVDIIEALVKKEYAENYSAVIRRALEEANERMLKNGH